MKSLILAFTLLFGFTLNAQIQDGWVYFTDKENVADALANPITILSQTALDRKALHNTPIDERDVPVNENYITQLKNTPGISVLAKSKWMNCAYVRGTQSHIEALLNEPYVLDIEFADKDLNFSPAPVPRTTSKFDWEMIPQRISYDYGLAANQIEMLGGDFLHEEDYTGEGIIIGVFDSAFPNVLVNPAFSHVNNENRLLGTYDFVLRQEDVTASGSHGARTYSNIAAILENEFVGTAPNASFYLFRTEDGGSENPVEEAYWVEALERADSLGVALVNTSLGYQDYDNPNYDHSYEDLDGQTTFSARGANHAFDKGMLLVTSAGNDGGGFTFVGTPGDSPGMLTVGAVDSDGNYASFSSIGPTVDGRVKPDVMAQGAAAAVVDQDGFVTFNNGTSFSSPILAGVVASLWQARPQTTNAQLMQIVKESATLYNNPTPEMGYGIPNFENALQALLELGVHDNLYNNNILLYPNPATTTLTVQLKNMEFPQEISIYNVLGLLVKKDVLTNEITTLSVESLPVGMYMVTIVTNDKRFSYKLIKSK